MPNHVPASPLLRAAAAGGLLLAAAGCGSSHGSGPPRRAGPFQNGISLATHVGTYSHPDGPATLRELKRHRVGWIQMVPFAWQLDTSRPDLTFRDHTRTQTAFIESVHRAGMRVMLKPHVWSPQFWGESGRWRGDIGMGSGDDWDRWFRNYEAFLLHYARLAEAAGADAFTVGLEYVQATRERPDDWRRLIRKVRQVYSGPLTYGAHFPEEIERIDFWDALDSIGVVLYPELSEEPDPDLDALLAGWRPVRESLRRLSARHGKPVLIIEVGFNSIVGAARRPWEWARDGSRLDLDLQARCYEATFRTFHDLSWLEGIYLWKWSIDSDDGGPADIHYTPKGKPAAAVLREWFGRWDGAEGKSAGRIGR